MAYVPGILHRAKVPRLTSRSTSAVLGFPRIGPHREMKKALEAYWSDKISSDDLLKIAKEQRLNSYEIIKSKGVDFVPSGTFSFYDHVLDTSNTFGIIPEAYAKSGLSPLDTYFAMARGHQKNGVDLPATEMKKWFDSNYHYLVPEFSEYTTFKVNNTKPVDDFVEAQEAGYNARPVLVGPITLLYLGKISKDSKDASFNRYSLLPKLTAAYGEMLKKLADAGASWVQIDEPVLVLDDAKKLAKEFKETIESLHQAAPSLQILIATYFGRLEDNVNIIKDLPIAGIHIDLDRAPQQLEPVLQAIGSTKIGISLGLVSGRNIWKTDLATALEQAKKAISVVGAERVQIASSSSLLHTPITTANEKKLDSKVLDWFSFATEKCGEIATLGLALQNSPEAEDRMSANAKSIAARREFEKSSDPAVRDRVSNIKPEDLSRKSPFPHRREIQRKYLKLPPFPTTTIGSFPQTKEIRQYRSRFSKGDITKEEYEKFLENEIKSVVEKQEALGLDVLVHGEPERNDMVQYFGEQLEGFVFTENAWVQSFGSRYVRPPIIVSDVSRPQPMTVRWSSYAQSLTQKVMKGMLTGPVTILNWSFPRVDIGRDMQSKQIALALRDEVIDLEKAGIRAVQVDEPAIREGLPLRRGEWAGYLKWAVDSFRLSVGGASDAMNTASHFCYSDFNDIMSSVIALDADMISIENSKSDAKLLDIFKSTKYPNEIGPGVYDIHSPRVPTEQEMCERIKEMCQYIDPTLLWVNPDCGLKTRTWSECTAQLKAMVSAADSARKQFV
ncbi:5-methyltetrahydropteroyltriglutamate--homocysteine S-methyltransferase [Malassezia vespertilionis]|uniref:5-methyltetrahydropteroyltriglutamate--homocysteine S-methyltransferase n=1 Tax=Malassezia vespertilionis TaxID=2020962 RepID=A0A2N1J982_9BASI|nr:5-methyltetrahydropteroyltriglutamate--homocysteine S-methyltransferase [Malassezia vespertilionis]PKI83123.1 Met6p [Malassezia vespertilionis]WFD07517.1 5-methyltetrahydropteroyltriglutamate--homocysteine S-methyltransferase [Malassezia vespertilionis]